LTDAFIDKRVVTAPETVYRLKADIALLKLQREAFPVIEIYRDRKAAPHKIVGRCTYFLCVICNHALNQGGIHFKITHAVMVAAQSANDQDYICDKR